MSVATCLTDIYIHDRAQVLKHADSRGGHQESYGWIGDTLLLPHFTNTP